MSNKKDKTKFYTVETFWFSPEAEADLPTSRIHFPVRNVTLMANGEFNRKNETVTDRRAALNAIVYNNGRIGFAPGSSYEGFPQDAWLYYDFGEQNEFPRHGDFGVPLTAIMEFFLMLFEAEPPADFEGRPAKTVIGEKHYVDRETSPDE